MTTMGMTEIREKLRTHFGSTLSVHSTTDHTAYFPYETVEKIVCEFADREGIEQRVLMYVFMNRFGIGNPETAKKLERRLEQNWLEKLLAYMKNYGLGSPAFNDRMFSSMRHVAAHSVLLGFFV